MRRRRSLAAAREPTTVVWREQAIAEIAGDQFAIKWLTGDRRNGQRLDADAAREIEARLETAREAAVNRGLSRRRRLSSSLRGAALLCFQPTGQAVCPTRVIATGDAATRATGQPASDQSPAAVATQDGRTRAAASKVDVLLIELIGLIAAALAAASSVRRIHGTPTPYGVPFAVAVLKLPTGALTAALGLLLIRAEFVPGLSALDSPAKIIGWAVILGYAQQLFTRFVDQRAQTVLDTAGAANSERRRGAAPAPA